MMKIMDIGKEIIKELNRNGYEAYFVGGVVRDFILGREINDIDIATAAQPSEIIKIFDKTIPTGIKHGTITVIKDEHPFEVTTFRTEGKYLDYRHPEQVHFVKGLREDLSRRDFTMNAIAMDVNEKIIDPFHGMDDIHQGLITTVGNPNERFSEDPLRMLRAIRFSAQLGFRISNQTYQEIMNHADYLQHIATERIKAEFIKILAAPYIDQGLYLLFSTKLFYFFGVSRGGLNKIEKFLQQHLLSEAKDSTIRLAIFLFPLTQSEQRDFLVQMKFSNKEMRKIALMNDGIRCLEENMNLNAIKRCMITTNKEICIQVVQIFKHLKLVNPIKAKELHDTIIQLDQQITTREIRDLNISGKDLLKTFNLPPGPWIKEVLDSLFEKVVYDSLPNEKERLIIEAEKIFAPKKR